MTIRFLDLHAQYQGIKNEIDAAISNVIRDSAFIGGKYVKEFEENFARYQEVNHCVGVGNGTDALEIAIEALQLPAGSEIIVPANSFIASSEAVTRSGCKVVFCDCDPDTYTVSVEDARSRVTDRTRAVVAVHLYGHPCDMDRLTDFADQYSLKIIEDCAQAHGARYKGRRVGGIGTIGTFSFYPGKNLGAYGDGGAIVTNDQDLAIKCRMIANHGRTEKYNHLFEGRNSRLDGLQAAILNVKLRHLDAWIERRRELADFYLETLAAVPGLTLPKPAEWAFHVWHLFVVRAERRDALKKHLGDQGVETGIHYPITLPTLKAYEYLSQQQGVPVCSAASDHLLSLPIGDHLTREELRDVVERISTFTV